MKTLDFTDAKENIKAILNQHEYQVYHQNHEGLLERLLNAIAQWLAKLIERLSANLGISHGTSMVVLYSVIGLIIAAFITMIIWILSRFRGDGRQKNRSVATAEELLDSTDSHLKHSQDAFEDGDTASAVRFAMLALIRRLDDRQWIVAKPWKTNREYYEELSDKNKPLADEFERLALFFDRTIYGGEIPTQAAYHQYREAITGLIAGMKTPQEQEGAL